MLNRAFTKQSFEREREVTKIVSEIKANHGEHPPLCYVNQVHITQECGDMVVCEASPHHSECGGDMVVCEASERGLETNRNTDMISRSPNVASSANYMQPSRTIQIFLNKQAKLSPCVKMIEHTDTKLSLA